MRTLLLFMLGLVACSTPSPTLEGRTLWNAKNLSNYSYTLQRSCFCEVGIAKAIRLEVRNGTLSSVKYVDSGLEVTENNLRPNIFKIEAFFDLIDTTLAEGGTVEPLSFDSTFGYPTRMNVDPIPDAADDGIDYFLSDLKAL
jgi:Family of unknown function (DUF6174)